MRALLAAVLCLVLLAPCAQAEGLFAWTLQEGGEGVTTPGDMTPAASGGVFIAGFTTAQDSEFGVGLGGKDGFVMRVSAQGHVLWRRLLGGSGDDIFTTVVETPDGGCLAMGTTTSSGGDIRSARGGVDAWIVRLDAGGETVWSKNLGGSSDDELLALLVNEDGSYFVCGRTQSRNGDLGSNYGGWDAWAALLGADDGRPLSGWPYRYGGAGDDSFFAVYPMAEGWLLLGETGEQSSVAEDGSVVYAQRPIVQILSHAGEPQWETPVLLGQTGVNTLSSLVETEVGWLLAGVTNSRSSLMPTPRGRMDIWSLNLRQGGTVYWQRVYGGSGDEAFHSVHVLEGKGYVLLGTTESADGDVNGAHGGQDAWVVHTGPNGYILWEQTIGGSTGPTTPVGLLQRDTGELLVVGTTTAQDGDIGRHISVRTGFFATLAPNGNLLSVQSTGLQEESALLQVCADGGIGYVLGVVRGVNAQGPVERIWLARLAAEGYQ